MIRAEERRNPAKQRQPAAQRPSDLQNCRIIKGLPFMEKPVLDALARQRYTPVTFQGRPVDVEYVIPFKLKLE